MEIDIEDRKATASDRGIPHACGMAAIFRAPTESGQRRNAVEDVELNQRCRRGSPGEIAEEHGRIDRGNLPAALMWEAQANLT